MRPAGKTFKMLLRALSHALENDGSCTILVFRNTEALDHSMHMLWDTVQPRLAPFYVVKRHEREFRFGNGSAIMFRSMDWVEQEKWRGLNVTHLEKDNSVEWVDYAPKFNSIYSVFEDKVERDLDRANRRN